MTEYFVQGGRPLQGIVKADGAKNAALPILFATLLCQSACTLENIPEIRDVQIALSILQEMGADIQRDGTTCLIDTRKAIPVFDTEKSRKLRAGIYLLGAMLPRFQKATLPYPGGCNFGVRPIDYHIDALRKMGAVVAEDTTGLAATAKKLFGCDITLPRPSVGATVNILLAAVTAQGETRLHGAATEPHITDLIRFLNAAGARITGENTNELRIFGVSSLHGAHHKVIGDSIEGCSYLLMAAATGGDVTVKGIDAAECVSFQKILQEMGATVTASENTMQLSANKPLNAVAVATAPYPGFPTDLQPILGGLFTVCRGTGCIRETVWENRFRYTEELRKMGADIAVDANAAVFHGGRLKKDTVVSATDLRGGAALVLAALATEGKTCITDAHLIERGYSHFIDKIHQLGGSLFEKVNM